MEMQAWKATNDRERGAIAWARRTGSLGWNVVVSIDGRCRGRERDAIHIKDGRARRALRWVQHYDGESGA